MRLILVLGLFCFALTAARASESVKGAAASALPEKTFDPGAASSTSRYRCARKITIGPEKNEIACLMTKRNAFASAPAGTIPQPPHRNTRTGEPERKPIRRR
jgi:hypothetical protein